MLPSRVSSRPQWILSSALVAFSCNALSAAQPDTTPGRVGPSFDCSKAKEALSGLICGSDQLSWLDFRFNQAYLALRLQVGEAGQFTLRQETVDFQAQVIAACNLPKSGFVAMAARRSAESCVGKFYQQQRNAWVARLSPLLQEEASRTPEEHIRLQVSLQKLGYIPPNASIDGLYGPATRAAIAAWQIANNYDPSGVLSEVQAQLLNRAAETTPLSDTSATKLDDDRRLAIIRAEADKARAEADKAQAEADRARAETELAASKDRIASDEQRKAAEEERKTNEAHGLEP